jgi:hypothetical protein
MTPPRPSRTARWVIGLILTAVLTLITAFCGLIAVADAVAGPALAATAGPLDSRATATVLGVHTYSAAGEPVSADGDWAGGGGYAEIDVGFTVQGEREATTIDWPMNQALPAKGDRQTIAYRSADPEDSPRLASVTAPDPDPFPAATGQPSGPVSAAVIFGLLALLTLIGTVFWALAVPTATPRSQKPDALDWNQPPPAWPGPVAAASRLSSSPIPVADPPPPPGLVPPS